MSFIILQAAEGSESFFDSPWWKFTSLMSKAVLAALWLALVFWTYKDARRRISDPMMIGVAVATSFIFPFVGVLFYTILRPPEYLEDVLERDLEIQTREQELGGGVKRCPACRTHVREDYLVCPRCLRKLKSPCAKCGRPLEPAWKVCPYCEAEVGGGAPSLAAEDELFA